MPEELVERGLFGGAVTCSFPYRFQDVSTIREVPDNQEVYVDPSRDESLIVELLEMKHDVPDSSSATWFFQDLASEQDAEGNMVIQDSGAFEAIGLSIGGVPATITTAIGQMAISKGRQGRDAQNIVKVYLANIRLKGVNTDVLISAYEPLLISPLSETANSVGAGLAIPAVQTGLMPMGEVWKNAVLSFKVNDWGLFGTSAA